MRTKLDSARVLDETLEEVADAAPINKTAVYANFIFYQINYNKNKKLTKLINDSS